MNNVVNEFEASTENIVPTESIFSDKFNDFIKIQKLTYSCIEWNKFFPKRILLRCICIGHMWKKLDWNVPFVNRDINVGNTENSYEN